MPLLLASDVQHVARSLLPPPTSHLTPWPARPRELAARVSDEPLFAHMEHGTETSYEQIRVMDALGVERGSGVEMKMHEKCMKKCMSHSQGARTAAKGTRATQFYMSSQTCMHLGLLHLLLLLPHY